MKGVHLVELVCPIGFQTGRIFVVRLHDTIAGHKIKELSNSRTMTTATLLYTVYKGSHCALHVHLTFVPWLTPSVSSSRGRRKQGLQWRDQQSVLQLPQLLQPTGQCSVQ